MVIWAARVLFSLLFIQSGLSHVSRFDSFVKTIAAQGLPAPHLLAAGAIALLLLGGASLMIGIRPKIGAAMILIFLVPVTIIMHRFWGLEDAAMAARQQIQFLKNLGLIAAALLLTQTGGGQYAILPDEAPAKTSTAKPEKRT